MSPIRADRRGRALAGLAAAAVFAVGIAEALISMRHNVFPNRGTVVPVAAATAAAVGMCRYRPGVAVALAWLLCGYQALTGAPMLVSEVALAAVTFAAARWGGVATAVAGAATVVLIGGLAVVDLGAYAAFLLVVLCGVAWLAGLALRRSDDRAAASLASQHAAEAEARRAHREREQADEIARLREEQARLARDVHDVVGHSLAVILAQAESAPFVPDGDSAVLRDSMANIATLARDSLREVRQVLTANSPSATGPGELRTLVDGVAASGHEIRFAETGTARAMLPEPATVAYRVLQEMLTNAIRHGGRETPIEVELCWGEELRIRTANAAAPASAAGTGPGGSGLDGMRRRLESIGGRLEVHHESGEPGPSTFTAIARVPVRRLEP
ncbi:sensor histidine kinase [Nocardia seriolae]|uniref:histidine kinase n=2 Tax=Nocardia seriolae TaxID=37332 RepID=A0ABC8AYG6_9NOCA|nr:histidine kinase [Nocardia seriolae]APA99110.1 Histidine kinase [Nocardia seriolae]OJF80857.1 hypothetical protein NS14008_18665 [Nocardia seriolae]QOW35186.1 two-component sensor histidine kinase [Nocardia seriolae]QUN17348.1 two-component sensor histidine kinase [Nocardia seriolae]WKY49308.1 histidine kinase [Nocardia seriolae]